MSPQALQERLHQLFQQARWPEAATLLESYLADFPADYGARLNYVTVLLNQGDKKTARELIGPMLEETPDDEEVLRVAAYIELIDKKPKIAEQFANQLIQLDAENDEAYLLMAKAKLEQRNYDAAIEQLDTALSLDPQNQEALNLKIYVGGFLGKDDTASTIDDALANNPEDASTIANHGYQLLREGKVDLALDRLGEALAKNPNNQLGRYAMLEALKARFWPYRMYFKYQEAMAKLSGGASFGIMIGLWLAVNYLSSIARNNPEYEPYLMPIVYLMVGLFLLTWIIDPIMNFYLLTNKYGRLLLDKDSKLMAKLVGASLGVSLLALITYFTSGAFIFQAFAFAFLVLTIPLGSFLRPIRKNQRMIMTAYTIGLVVAGIGAILLNNGFLINVALFGLLGYQFVLNGMMAREGGRTFGQ
ncbi:MAG: tetratricopeptide repeat protein [Bacteroidota bacterium]